MASSYHLCPEYPIAQVVTSAGGVSLKLGAYIGAVMQASRTWRLDCDCGWMRQWVNCGAVGIPVTIV